MSAPSLAGAPAPVAPVAPDAPDAPVAPVASDGIRERPAVGRTRVARAPATAERLLASGLRVVAVRRPSVPLVELRLRVPFPSARGDRGRVQATRADLLGETLLSGTATRDSQRLAEELQALGAALGASIDSDRLLISGSGLASGLPGLLALLADVVTGASYPAKEVEGERERLAQELAIARSQPSVLAGVALSRRLYGEHPYAYGLPLAADVAAVTPAQLRSLHRSRVLPGGAVLLVVGDVSPARALDAAETALADWQAGSASAATPPLPPIEPGPLLLVDRPGSVQSNLRLAGPAVPRSDPGYPAVQLANTLFGGYFSSRLVANLREDKGYTYHPRSGIDHSALGASLSVAADVATEVTAAALAETHAELARMATTRVSAAELDDARRYAVGTLALGTATQAGLASTLAALLGAGLPLDWVRTHPQRLEAVTVDDVHAHARQLFAPTALVTVVLGDAERVADEVRLLEPVTVTSSADL